MLDPLFWSGRRVLLTGHTGFKGSWLALWLSKLGAEVTGVALDPPTAPSLFNQLSLANQLSGHFLNDIRDTTALKRVVDCCQPEVVFHLAAQPLVRDSYRIPLETWAINVLGSLNILESLRSLSHHCAVVMITTDKVYANREWNYGYRECDRLGGSDPYSASKAAAELAIGSWRSSFCGTASHQTPHLSIATARAGNVIGGGDWALDRILPDAVRALASGQVISVRHPEARRPWQHVLEPLGGYLLLAEKLSARCENLASCFNFGPSLESNRSVRELVDSLLLYWHGTWQSTPDINSPHEAQRLHLQIDQAYHQLGWVPRWTFNKTVERTIKWYLSVERGTSPLECCLNDLQDYQSSKE